MVNISLDISIFFSPVSTFTAAESKHLFLQNLEPNHNWQLLGNSLFFFLMSASMLDKNKGPVELVWSKKPTPSLQ